MEKQQTFTDIEYENRRRKTKRETFLEKMDKIVPWEAWVETVRPYYVEQERGRNKFPLEQMLRMTALQVWFSLSDESVEDAIYDSYSMKTFMGIYYGEGQQAPDATTLCRFRKLLNTHQLQEKLFDQVNDLLEQKGKMMHGGSIVDATIVEAPSSTKNSRRKRDPEMHQVKKNNEWHFGMRAHIGIDAGSGYIHTVIAAAANQAEVKVAPGLLRRDDEVMYGDAGYTGIEKYIGDGIKREYRIAWSRGYFLYRHGGGLAYEYEKQREKRKAAVRSKVEYAFHIVKNIFGWRKTRYRGIAKNQAHAHLLFASANLYMLAASS